MQSTTRTTGLPSRTLGLFAKQPLPGLVKTRLAAAVSPAWAARVATAFLHDALDRLSRVHARRVLAFAPAGTEASFVGCVQGRFHLTPQADGDLGKRMAAFFAKELGGGNGAVVLIGTDSPTLPLNIVDLAFDELERADLVLGPATDGGYYLIGCARWLPPVFDGIRWGGSCVLAETVARMTDAARRIALLPPWYDVDTIDDWTMLCGHIAAMRRAGLNPEVPRVEELVEEWRAQARRQGSGISFLTPDP